MKNILVLILVFAPCVLAQDAPSETNFQTAGPAGAIASAELVLPPGSLVRGVPFSATITDQTIQTLADGTRIVQTSSGSIARDSEGRTRQEPPVPAVDDPSLTPPRLAFIQDPVTKTSYVLKVLHENL